MLRPVIPQNPDDARMVQLDGALKKGQQGRRKPGPPLLQDQVVAILNAQARGAMDKVNRIQQFLQVQKLDVPGMILLFEDCLQGPGGTPVSAARIVKNYGEVVHCNLLTGVEHKHLNFALREDQRSINFS